MVESDVGELVGSDEGELVGSDVGSLVESDVGWWWMMVDAHSHLFIIINKHKFIKLYKSANIWFVM